jgi:hypothetical protein
VFEKSEELSICAAGELKRFTVLAVGRVLSAVDWARDHLLRRPGTVFLLSVPVGGYLIYVKHKWRVIELVVAVGVGAAVMWGLG